LRALASLVHRLNNQLQLLVGEADLLLARARSQQPIPDLPEEVEALLAGLEVATSTVREMAAVIHDARHPESR